jgi:hypothetical protein
MLARSETKGPYLRRLFALAFIPVLVLLGGCGGQPMPFPTPASEIGKEPGLLSGEEGAFVLYRQREQSPEPR